MSVIVTGKYEVSQHPDAAPLPEPPKFADEAQDQNVIYIMTTDTLGDTGTVSWSWIFMKHEGEYIFPDDLMRAICGIPFGYVWKPNHRDKGYAFNIFQDGGRGLLCGGGWEVSGDEAEDERCNGMHTEALPGCKLLMSTEAFDWLSEHVLHKFGRPYRRFHAPCPVLTNGPVS